MAPSATNKQPWRIVRRGDDWHFYLVRTKGYGKGSPWFKLLRIADLQRVDLGIAMCHFELVARESGRDGRWVVEDPGLALPGPGHRVHGHLARLSDRRGGRAARRHDRQVGFGPAMMGASTAAAKERHAPSATQGPPRPEHQPHVPGVRPRQPLRPPRPLLRAGAGRACGRRRRPSRSGPRGGPELLGVFTPREEHQSYPAASTAA